MSFRFSSTTLRFKIMAGLLLSLVPMLVITGVSYRSSHNKAIEDVKRTIRYVNHYSKKENIVFAGNLEKQFLTFTKEDIFGMAIEFDTIEEINRYFKSLLRDQKGFSMLVLTDTQGNILTLATEKDAASDTPVPITVRQAKEVSGLAGKAVRSVSFAHSDLSKHFGYANTPILFAFRTKNNAGNQNGFVLAYISEFGIQNRADSEYLDMKTNGLGNAIVAIADKHSGKICAISDSEGPEKHSEMEAPLKSWFGEAGEGEMRHLVLRNDNYYGIFSSFRIGKSFAEKNAEAGNSVNLGLALFVPEQDVISEGRKTLMTSGMIGLCGLLVIGMIGLSIIRLIVTPIYKLTEKLMDIADNVAAASSQISKSSLKVAEGASMQAASVKESCVFLGEMSSVCAKTSEMTCESESLMNENSRKSSNSLRSVAELAREMAQIETDSDQMGHIINTIEEIAFQTKLLALNAAIEAARAGEQGAGFAVVAGEVGNLAVRAAEAAKNTQDMLDSVMKRVSDAARRIQDINEDFENIIGASATMSEKTTSVAMASKEQMDKVNTIRQSVVEINKIIQQNAAHAEESASACEEMNAQAEQMKESVNALLILIEGKKRKSE